MPRKTFEQVFGFPPEANASAPGRVNLLGEHTDYNDGFVLPIAIPQRTTVHVARSRDTRSHIYSANLDKYVKVDEEAFAHSGHAAETRDAETMLDEEASAFARYVTGCMRVLAATGCDVPPLAVLIESSVPIGAGLSSSAALEVATLRALRMLLSLELGDVVIAELAQQAEVEYVGVRCGIMDQMAASLASEKQMLFIDTRSLETMLMPLPEHSEIVVLDSGVPRSLAASGYNRRRAECEEAAKLLGVAALRDITNPADARNLPPPLDRRARHVIAENERVLEAASGVGARKFGELMSASHASLRDDYEVSVTQLDVLVDLLQRHPSVFGARLTGAGFGGAAVALAHAGSGQTVASEVLRSYNAAGNEGRALI
jgi:galactokinase